MLWAMLKALAAFIAYGKLPPIVFQVLQVHQPHGFGTLSQVVCQIWWILSSVPCMKTFILPLKKLVSISCATGACIDFGAKYPVLSQECHSEKPVERIPSKGINNHQRVLTSKGTEK